MSNFSMVRKEIQQAFEYASVGFRSSLAVLQPFRRGGNEGYCERNIVEYYSYSLRGFGFRPFLEFPIPNGRVDALFIRGSTVVVLEAKQLARESEGALQADIERFSRINILELLNLYGYAVQISELYHVAICDCWCESIKENWIELVPQTYTFLSGFTTSHIDLTHSYNGKNHYYAWLLAVRGVQPQNLLQDNNIELVPE